MIQIVSEFLLDMNPLCADANLRNIATGDTADKTVNVNKAK